MDTPADPVEVLRRWEAAGGAWRLVARSASGVTVALLRCDGGEEVDRFASDRPELVDYLAGRDESSG